MPPKRTMLLTDWVTIATAGQTIDGRKIEEFKIKEAAETYNPEEYCAVINAEHLFGNFGTVRELQTAKDDKGRTILQARISPNDYAIQQNKQDYRLFTSVELTANFCGTGKYYLTGLALTDTPASVGTSELHFKARKNAEAYTGEEINIDTLTVIEEKDEEKLFLKFTNFFTRHFNLTPKEKPMNEEQFKTMTELLTANKDAMSKMSTAIEALTKKEEPKTPAAVPATEKASADAKPETDFGKIVDEKVKPLLDSFAKLESTVKDLFKEKPGTPVPNQTGTANNTEVI